MPPMANNNPMMTRAAFKGFTYPKGYRWPDDKTTGKSNRKKKDGKGFKTTRILNRAKFSAAEICCRSGLKQHSILKEFYK